MRKLMWFSAGFTAGLAAGIWLLDGVWCLCAAALLGICALLTGLLFSPGVKRRILAVIMVGCAVGLGWMFAYETIRLQPARACDGQYMQLQIQVTDYSYTTASGICANGVIALDGQRCKVTFYLDETIQLAPGDRVEGLFYMRYTGYDAKMSPTYHQGEGIPLLAYLEDDLYTYHPFTDSIRYAAAEFRQTICSLLDRIFPADTAGFARALLLGDSSKLSQTEDNAFQNSGIRHIIAVSGLHVSILFGFVYQTVGKRGWLTALIGLPVLLLFAAIAGFTPSVIRACVMQGLMILAMVFHKEYDPPTALAFAVLVILGINPMALTSVSFQLSVGCVLGIFLFSARVHKYILGRKWMGCVSGKSVGSRLKRWFAQSVSVSVSAIFLTTPISAYYFGAVSTLSVVTNLLTLWAVSYIFCGIIISCIAGFLFLPAGSVISWTVSWLMRYVQLMARLIAAIPYSMVSADNTYIVCWMLICYLLVLVTLCSKEKRPALLLTCAAVTFCASLLLSWLEQRQDSYRMTVLDVGQGQCILFQSGDDCYVVDCGGDSGDGAADLAAHTLRTQGITQIDGLILTHFDRDHAGGALSLMSQIPVETVYLPDADPEEQLRIDLETQYGDRIDWVRGNTYFPCGEAYISIYPAELGSTGNNSSLTILFQAENCDILATGDLNTTGEQKLLDTVRLPDIEILLAGHHGADNSTSFYLLDTLRPDAVVISVGKDNTYGHPSSEVLGRLELFGCRVWRTDQNGTVIFRG